MTREEFDALDIICNCRINSLIHLSPCKVYQLGYITRKYNNYQLQVFFDGDMEPTMVGYKQICIIQEKPRPPKPESNLELFLSKLSAFSDCEPVWISYNFVVDNDFKSGGIYAKSEQTIKETFESIMNIESEDLWIYVSVDEFTVGRVDIHVRAKKNKP